MNMYELAKSGMVDLTQAAAPALPDVQVKIKQVYGRDMIYPANETAILFTRFTGQKTLTPRDLALIRQLGFHVDQVFDKGV